MRKGCRHCYWLGYHYVPVGDGTRFVLTLHDCMAVRRVG
jgi:hypothetical protein